MLSDKLAILQNLKDRLDALELGVQMNALAAGGEEDDEEEEAQKVEEPTEQPEQPEQSEQPQAAAVSLPETGLGGWERTETWMFPRNNPHSAQLYTNGPMRPYTINAALLRILGDGYPQAPYKLEKIAKSVVHWGQRKLLISEIEFLTVVGKEDLEGATVVYAGAAPGSHIVYLAKLFPTVDFVLVDPASFTVKESPKIKIIQDLFTDKLATDLAAKHSNILFISDIRREGDSAKVGAKTLDNMIKEDMDAQMSWHLKLKSKRSMLKFRLPWDKGSTTYLNGDIYLPVWGRQTTTECRLITSRENPAAMRVYSNEQYESQCFYFNRIARPSLYSHWVEAEGIDHCYDCRAEVDILYKYLDAFGDPTASRDDIVAKVAEMSKAISRSIPGNRTLLDPTPSEAEQARRANTRRQQQGPRRW
jgi:hypothetical protein